MNNQVPNTDPSLSDEQVVRHVYPEAWKGQLTGSIYATDQENVEDCIGDSWADARSKLPTAVSEVDGATETDKDEHCSKCGRKIVLVIGTEHYWRHVWGEFEEKDFDKLDRLGCFNSAMPAPQGTVEGETRPKLEATYFVHRKDGSMEVSTDPYRRDYVSYQDFCVIRELLLSPPVTQEIPPMDVTKDDIYEAERRLYLRKRGNDPLRLDLMAEIVCRERQWQQTFGKVAEPVAPPSVAMQDDEFIKSLLLGKPMANGEWPHLPHCNGDRSQPAGTLGITCCCKPFWSPKSSGEGSGVPALDVIKEAKALVEAMETCHVCKGLLVLQEDAVHCEDCPYDCENHDGPECVPIYELHRRLKAALSSPLQEHALQSSVSNGAVDPDERRAEVACACGERWKAIGNGSLAWVNKRFDEHLQTVAPPDTKGGTR